MDQNYHLANVRRISQLLDNQFRILGFKFGLDPLIGLIPGFGDAITFILSFYLLWVADQADISQDDFWKMVSNIIFDLFIGLVPVLGDVGDFFVRSNTRNLRILEEHLKTRKDATTSFLSTEEIQ